MRESYDFRHELLFGLMKNVRPAEWKYRETQTLMSKISVSPKATRRISRSPVCPIPAGTKISAGSGFLAPVLRGDGPFWSQLRAPGPIRTPRNGAQ